MDVSSQVSRGNSVTESNEIGVSLLGICPELAIPGSAIVQRLESVTFDEVREVVDRHLWPRFYGNASLRIEDNQMTQAQREDFLAAMGVHFDNEPAKRRISKSIFTEDWNKLTAVLQAKLKKLRINDDRPVNRKFIESKDDWYQRYSYRQTAITYEYAKLVASCIHEKNWTECGISPHEFIFVAKPLYEKAANKAGYFKANNAAKSSIPMLGTLVSDNWYAARVKQLFLQPYLDEVKRLEELAGKRLI